MDRPSLPILKLPSLHNTARKPWGRQPHKPCTVQRPKKRSQIMLATLLEAGIEGRLKGFILLFKKSKTSKSTH